MHGAKKEKDMLTWLFAPEDASIRIRWTGKFETRVVHSGVGATSGLEECTESIKGKLKKAGGDQ